MVNVGGNNKIDMRLLKKTLHKPMNVRNVSTARMIYEIMRAQAD